MDIIYNAGKKNILSWCENIEDGAMAQALNLASLPFIVGHVALMADSHQGYGMPIGGVIACKDVIIPMAVGVDIGCGMRTVKLDGITKDMITVDIAQNLIARIRRSVPMGHNWHKEPQDFPIPDENSGDIYGFQYENCKSQVGTLGGGNHFIEFQYDEDEDMYFTIHSGSRNLGKQIGDYYNQKAKEVNAMYYSSVPNEHDLAFLTVDSIYGHAYLKDMDSAVNFAYQNRTLIAEEIINELHIVFKDSCDFSNVAKWLGNRIDTVHNFAKKERHFGKDCWVHRKGAVYAGKGLQVIIPGSQGTATYIAEGLGNRLSFSSSSHGAGRAMGRKKAQENLDLEEQKAILDSQGIFHTMTTKESLDEAPGSYKDIDRVMYAQNDLVKIVKKLNPLISIKA